MKRIKKAFTLVELLVVIAILAVLATVGVISYGSFKKKATISNDITLVRQINDVLKAEEIEGNVPNNMYEAKQMLIINGYGIDISAPKISTKGYYLGYDVRQNRALLLNSLTSTKAVEAPTDYKMVNTYDVFVGVDHYIDNCIFSEYLNRNATDVSVTTDKGFDVGDCTTLLSFTYSNASVSKDIIIRTNSEDTKITINDQSSDGRIDHYGTGGFLNVVRCATASYHENGYIPQGQIAFGRVVNEVYNDDETKGELLGLQNLFLVAKDTSSFNEIVIGAATNAKIPSLDRTDVSIPTKGVLVVEVQTGVTNTSVLTDEYIYLTKAGVIEQVVVKDKDNVAYEVAKDRDVSVDQVGVAGKIDTTKTAAEQITNIYAKNAAGTSYINANGDDITLDQILTDGVLLNVKADASNLNIGTSEFDGGAGVEAFPFLISTAEQFVKINQYNNGYYFKLTKDIQLKSTQVQNFEYDDNDGYLDTLTDVSIDGNGKTIKTSVTNTFSDYNPYLIVRTFGNFTLKNAKVINGNAVIYSVQGDATFNKVIAYGTTTGSSNNASVRYIQYFEGSGIDQTINFIDCDNYADILGSGYTAVYIGNLKFVDKNHDITVNFVDCDNYGVIRSTGSGASMILANPNQTYGSQNKAFINTTNCHNYGVIISNKSYSNLLLSGVGEPYYGPNNNAYRRGIWLNGVSIDYTSSDHSGDMYNAILTGCGDSLTGVAIINANYQTLGTSDGKFVLNEVNNATTYKLMFSFAASGRPYNGGNVNYTLTFDSTLPSDINVGEWINKTSATEEIVTHNEYGATYYTSGNSYVFYSDTGYITPGHCPLASFIAYNADGDILSVQTYRYPAQ